jgi:hypothetical protein
MKIILRIFAKCKGFCKLHERQILNSDGNNFPNTLLYIRAAAGCSIWNRGLSLLSACGYFFAIFLPQNSSDK